MLVDTHCHLNFEAFDEDRAAVLARAQAADVAIIINPAIDLATSQAILALAERESAVYAAIGMHPNSTARFATSDIATLAELADHPRLVAIGEIGLDYHWDDSPRSQQFAAFEAQLALAARLELPVIIHNREASQDTINILESWAAGLPSALQGRPGVMHAFSGDMAIAERALAAGFYLGFGGPVTYKKADETRAIAAAVPLDRLLIETDAPFLTPTPHRGKRNEPSYVALVAERLAAVRQLPVTSIAAATTENACRLFRLPVEG